MAHLEKTMKRLLAPLVLLWPGLAQAQIVEYYHLDAVGNVRAVTNQQGQVIERHDYLPFGEELCGTAVCASVTPGQPKRFTGKERDAETGLDYFGARYYGSKIGRFTTFDPNLNVKRALLDPQQWNRYAYVSNNPLRFVDPDGREQTVIMGGRTYMGGVDNMPAGSQRAQNQVFGALVAGTAAIALGMGAPALVMEAQIAAGSCGASPACQNAVRSLAEGVSGAPPGAMGAGAFTSKAAARAAIEAMELSEAQAGAAIRAVQRATTASTIEIAKQESGSLVVSVSRAGRDGRQVMEHVISPEGTKTVVQKAFDASGKLVHYDAKTP